jgi:hypothetical protein
LTFLSRVQLERLSVCAKKKKKKTAAFVRVCGLEGRRLTLLISRWK